MKIVIGRNENGTAGLLGSKKGKAFAVAILANLIIYTLSAFGVEAADGMKAHILDLLNGLAAMLIAGQSLADGLSKGKTSSNADVKPAG